MEGPCAPTAGQAPEACEQGQEGREGWGSQGVLGEGGGCRCGGSSWRWSQGPPGGLACAFGGHQCQEALRGLVGEGPWRLSGALPLSPLPPHSASPGPLRSMVEDLQSEESDEDDSSSGEEAAGKTNPGRDSR